jgi:hypothetical protein
MLKIYWRKSEKNRIEVICDIAPQITLANRQQQCATAENKISRNI